MTPVKVACSMALLAGASAFACWALRRNNPSVIDKYRTTDFNAEMHRKLAEIVDEDCANNIFPIRGSL